MFDLREERSVISAIPIKGAESFEVDRSGEINEWSLDIICMEKTSDIAEVHLLVGFLGAGKTTLIRRLLREPGAERLAVIQNEFAEGNR